MTDHSNDHLTIAQGRQLLIANRKKGTKCLLCNRPAKIYHRVLGGSACYVLILLYRRFKMHGPEWVHVLEFLSTVPLQGDGDKLRTKLAKGDWQKTRWWGFIVEKAEKKSDGNPCAGYWQITDTGVKFVEQQISVPRAAFEFRSELIDWDTSGFVTIKQAMMESFNYDALMKF